MERDRLVAALRGEDPEAARELVDACGERLFRSAFLLCGHEADAKDLVQETFLQAARGVGRFRGQSSVYTWLHGILVNLARHYHRDRKRLVLEPEPIESEVPAQPELEVSQADARTASTAIGEALNRLSEPHRVVLVLRYYENLRIGEIAAALGVSQGTVKSRLHYATAEMQRLLPAEMNLFGHDGTNVMKR
jgi:RNA polymerase sigma-70 factor (ECF subfamily)